MVAALNPHLAFDFMVTNERNIGARHEIFTVEMDRKHI
jgi:hypothetical protein